MNTEKTANIDTALVRLEQVSTLIDSANPDGTGALAVAFDLLKEAIDALRDE